jgi:hypothetical protein
MAHVKFGASVDYLDNVVFYAAHIVAFLQSALNDSILYATSLTRQFPLLHSLILTFVPVLRLSKWTRPR